MQILRCKPEKAVEDGERTVMIVRQINEMNCLIWLRGRLEVEHMFFRSGYNLLPIKLVKDSTEF